MDSRFQYKKKYIQSYILSKEFITWIARNEKRNDWHCFIQHAWWVHIILRIKMRWKIEISRFHTKKTHNPQGDNTTKTHTIDKETNNTIDNNYCNKVYTLIKEFTQILRSKRTWLEFLISNNHTQSILVVIDIALFNTHDEFI